jgi:chromate transporter
MTENAIQQPALRPGIGELAGAFLRLGFIAFGGPAAHIAMMEDEFVRRRGWLTRDRFLDLVGAVSLLPGPSSTELAIYLGQIRGGIPGLLAAGAAFVLPAAVMVVGLAWAYLRYGRMPQVAAILFGVKPVVVVLIAQAVWSLARTALKSKELAFLAAVVVVLAALRVSTIALLIGTGVAWIVAQRPGGPWRAAAGATGTAVAPAATGAIAGNIVASSSILLYFLKVGAILVGSGYVLLAVLRADLVVRLHWLTEAQLLDAVAVSQATPGPFFTVATFIGYVLAGWKGATLATVGVFLPAFAYVAATARFLPKLRQSPAAAAFLDGVNAAAVALMAFVGFQFAHATLLTVPAAAICAISAVLLFRYRVNSAWLVLFGAAAGGVLKVLRFV